MAGGPRYTFPTSSPNHKLHLLGVVGYGATKVQESEQKGLAGGLGIGWEFVPEPGNGLSHGLGLGAQIDAVAAKGQKAQVRVSVGLVYRLKKEHGSLIASRGR